MAEQVSTAGDPWWMAYASFGGKLLETATESANDYARAKLRKELKIDEMLAEQRANDATTNADVLNLTSPVKGTNADGSTLVQTVQFAGVTVQKSTLQVAGIGVGALVLGLLAYSALK